MVRKNLTADIVIVGGGLAGAAAAVGIARLGFTTIHLAPKAPADRRTSALMGPSIKVLVDTGLVDDVSKLGTPLAKIRIIDATNRLLRAPETLFDSTEANIECFGWNFGNQDLLSAFDNVAKTLSNYKKIEVPFSSMSREGDGFSVQLEDGQNIACHLLVGADGKKSAVRAAADITVREKKHRQSALVADLNLERPLDDMSVEFHYPNGPFTLVPAGGNRANLVWIDNAETLNDAVVGGDDALVDIFQTRAQHLFGKLELASSATIFPLSSLTATSTGANGIVLVGESAHAFPPIGAQGLNLGLRDIADLLKLLQTTDRDQSNWADRVSTQYSERRASDLKRTSTMVDMLFQSLLLDFLPMQAVRAGGLWALKIMPHLRKKAFAQGMGA